MKLVAESKLDEASFTGWRPGSVYTLANGQCWRQTSEVFGREQCNLHWPAAKVWKSGSTYYLELEGLWDIKKVEVERDTDSEEPAAESVSSEIKELPKDDVLLAVEKLVAIYEKHPEGFVRGTGGTPEQEIRRIGSMLNAQGGMELMQAAHETFVRTSNIRGAGRNLEIMWGGIGDWLS